MRIKKGDTVLVITGKDKGKKGKVLKAMPKENKIIVAHRAMSHDRGNEPAPGIRPPVTRGRRGCARSVGAWQLNRAPQRLRSPSPRSPGRRRAGPAVPGL